MLWNQLLPQIGKEPFIRSALTGQTENISHSHPNWAASRAMRQFFFEGGGVGLGWGLDGGGGDNVTILCSNASHSAGCEIEGRADVQMLFLEV